MILRGASDASTESATVGPFAPKTENADNRTITRQKKLLTPQLEPIPPPDCRFVRSDANRTARKYISLRVRFAAWQALEACCCLLSSTSIPACYHLRRAGTRKTYHFRRSRRQRQEHANRETGPFPARPRPLRRHHPRTRRHRHGGKNSRSAAALRHLGPFSAHRNGPYVCFPRP